MSKNILHDSLNKTDKVYYDKENNPIENILLQPVPISKKEIQKRIQELYDLYKEISSGNKLNSIELEKYIKEFLWLYKTLKNEEYPHKNKLLSELNGYINGRA